MKNQSLFRLLIGGLLLLLMTLSEAAQEKVFVIELLNGKVIGAKTMQVKRYDTVRWKVKSNDASAIRAFLFSIADSAVLNMVIISSMINQYEMM